MTPKISFLDPFPTELEDSVRDALEPLLPIVDGEVRTLFVQPTEDDDKVAAIAVRHRYHKANLYLSAEFFTYDADEKTEALLHELMHVLLDPLTRKIRHAIFKFIPDDATKSYLTDDFEEAEERIVDGLAIAFKETLEELRWPRVD